MKSKNIVLIQKLFAVAVAANFAAAPALGQVSISQQPLSAVGGAGALPNVLFTLDASGSMNWDYIPDYVAGSTQCMTDNTGGTTCSVGDPPYNAGGQFGSNGVAYDPGFSYLVGVDSGGTFHTNAPTGAWPDPTTNSVPNDAYGVQTKGSLGTQSNGSTNISNGITDRNYCNNAGTQVCKRNGQVDASGGALVSGPDDLGNTMAAGQFPYRSNKSNMSTVNSSSGSAAVVFGLPEMMQMGSAARSGTNVTVTTTEAHGLAAGDKVWVVSSTSGLAATCVNVNSATTGAVTPGSNLITSTFVYTSSASGTINATAVSFRKCVNLGSSSFSRSLGNATVTVTSTAHGLQTNDQISVANLSVANMSPSSQPVTITVTSTSQFTYASNCSGTNGSNACTAQSIAGSWVRTGLYNIAGNVNSQAPASYRIIPLEYCADPALTDCILATTPGTPPSGTFNNKTYSNPAHVRYCKTQEDAVAHGAVNGSSGSPTATPRCQGKYISVTGISYTYARYGLFARDTIRSAAAPFTGGRSARVDCPVTGCTYAQELQNYATWWAYYATRIQMMKSSVGIALRGFVSNPSGTPPKPDIVRLGFININPFYPQGSNSITSSVQSANYLRIDNFNLTNAGNFYTKFYAQKPNQSTPLREALSRAGWIFAGKLNQGLTNGIPAGDDPMQSSCQRNFTLMTTDGFWNGNGGQTYSGGTMGNVDNTDGVAANPYSSRAQGTYDGALAGSSGTLADVALYYYMNDLRGGAGFGPATSPNTTPPNGDVSANNVPTTKKDTASFQHMTTYTVGLADGLMLYDPNYDTPGEAGDFANIVAGAQNACFWASGVCNWPAPVADGQSALDDLWHAAVNGRGTYFKATDPRTLYNALNNAFLDFSKSTHAASAAATSSPNITATDNFAFTTTYQTNTWSGVVQAQALVPSTGEIDTTRGIIWSADQTLYNQTITTGRTLYMIDPTSASRLKLFAFGNMTTAATAPSGATPEQSFFTNHCTTAPVMSQCTTLLSAAQRLTVNAGTALVGFLSGQVTNEGILFRDRTETDPISGATSQTILGDIVDAEPAFVRLPPFKYTDTGYSGFQTAQATRAGTLYVAANDGYLHAFDSGTGSENWAYMPKFVMAGVYQLADMQYAGSHAFFLDATPETNDVFDVTASAWKTVIIGGAGGGARGYYALDITDPKNPKGLWEFCWDKTVCTTNADGIVHSDTDIGFSYGNPVIGKIPTTNGGNSISGKPLAGKWVVVLTSGLNNTGLPPNAPVGTTPGTGGGFFWVLDVITGEVLLKIPTISPVTGLNVGNTTLPSGLLKHAGFYAKGLVDATIGWMYGGDQQGNVWRVDMSAVSATNPNAQHMVTLKDSSGNVQPITVRPVATYFNTGPTRIYYVGTGRYIANADTTDTSQQTIYGIKDQDSDYGTNVRSIGLVQQTLQAVAQSSRTITTNTVNWSTQNGFFIDLNPGGTSPGERVIVDPRLELGTLVFTTNTPVVGGCSAGGTSFIYNLDYLSGSYVQGTALNIAGSYVNSFLVGVTPIQVTTGEMKTVNTDSTGKVGTGKININTNPKGVARFNYRER